MSDSRPDTERRENMLVRTVFVEACETLRPFFESHNHWEGKSHEHMAYQSLKEHFPQLSTSDTIVIVSTARRLFSSGKKYPPLR